MFWSRHNKNSANEPARFSEEIVARSLNLQPQCKHVKLFVSHRYGRDDAFHARMTSTAAIEAICDCRIEDVSITVDRIFAGPRGGQINDIAVRAGLIDAISSCDIFVVESRQKRVQADWVRWELEIAALALKKPVLFVDHVDELAKPTDEIEDLRGVGARVYRCGPGDDELAEGLSLVMRDLGFLQRSTATAG